MYITKDASNGAFHANLFELNCVEDKGIEIACLTGCLPKTSIISTMLAGNSIFFEIMPKIGCTFFKTDFFPGFRWNSISTLNLNITGPHDFTYDMSPMKKTN
jgi:hypothetical protein